MPVHLKGRLVQTLQMILLNRRNAGVVGVSREAARESEQAYVQRIARALQSAETSEIQEVFVQLGGGGF
jgi:hypothetical protein